MNKYLYAILRLKTTSWIKYWLYNKSMKTKGVLSNILEGISFYLTDSLNRKFNLFQIIGRSMQEGTPTPENPVEIKNTGDSGSINEKVQNKNLFDESVIINATNWAYENGYYTGKANDLNNYFSNHPMHSKFKENTQYTFSWKGYTGTASNTRIRFVYTDGSYTEGAYINSTTEVSRNFVSSADKTIDRISLNWGTNGTIFIKDIQLEEGTTATEYQAHEEQNISFPLAQGQKLMQGDYLADDGVHHVENMIDLSSLSWEFKNTNTETGISTYSAHITNRKYAQSLSPKCTHFQYLGTVAGLVAMYSKDVGYCLYYNAEYVYGDIIYLNTTISTLSELQTWLSNNNVKFQYELVQEVIDPYTEEQQIAWEQIKALHTYKNVTHISSEDELPANLKIQYWKEG